MVKGLYIAATNLNANKKKLDVISNNLANIHTSGFKREDVEFESFNARLQSRIHGSMRPAEVGVGDVEFAKDGNEYTVSTKNGYFRFETKDGVHVSKDAKLYIDKEGYVKSVYKTASGQIDMRKGSYLLNGAERVRVSAGEELNKEMFEAPGVIHPYRANTIGTLSAGVKVQEIRIEHEQGTILRTENFSDFAISGDGYFTVLGQNGQEYLTRFGATTLNQHGELMTLNGAKLVGTNGAVKLGQGEFTINNFGEVIQNGEIIDRLKLVSVTDKSDLFKVGVNYFKLREPENRQGSIEPFKGELLQGYIERSNVDPITEMIRMMELNRSYEGAQKVITTLDEMLGKAVNELGKA